MRRREFIAGLAGAAAWPMAAQAQQADRIRHVGWVESKIGAGSTFFLEVPVDVEQQVGNA